MVRIAINGFGRIGRLVARLAATDESLVLTHINDPFVFKGGAESLPYAAYMFKRDTAQGDADFDIEVIDGKFIINGQEVGYSACFKPEEIPFANNADYVVDSTGIFKTVEKCQPHLQEGVKRVFISAPGDANTPFYLYGVNHENITDEKVISGTSCTTTCTSLPLKALLNAGIEIDRCMLTTIHAVTATQQLVDSANFKKPRLGRSAMSNIIPSTTGASGAVTRVIPELTDKMTGISLRVPVITGSLVDIVIKTKNPTSVEEINAAFEAAANGPLAGALEYSTEELVSSDIIGSTYGSIVDGLCTTVLGEDLVKCFFWYDNEASYTNNFVRLIKYVATKDF
ncbi:hypothetical protein PCE1_000684 [Barthelona sp. PCE]